MLTTTTKIKRIYIFFNKLRAIVQVPDWFKIHDDTVHFPVWYNKLLSIFTSYDMFNAWLNNNIKPENHIII